MPRRQTFPGSRGSVAALLCLLSGAASAQPEGPPAQAASPAPPAAEPSTPVDPSILDTDNRSAQNNALEQEITPQSEEAVARGLAALAATQNPDGSFGEPSWGRRVAVTSIACLAFMADGNLPGRGAYGEVVSKGLDYVLSACTESGLISAEAANGPMYGHGFAALFLGEVYGMTGVDDSPLSRRLHEALLKAVRLIETTQNDEGGWRYNPVPNDADVSVTICQVMALRSARNAGIEVRKTTIDRAVDYVRRCQNPDGGFRYQAEGGPSAWPRSAAGVAALYYAGIYDDRALSAGLDYLVQSALPGNNASQAHYYYGQYYAVQSMYLAGGQYWATWWPAIREELIQRQQPDGVWLDPSIGNIYGSSMALIVLQMPKRYLPIFQK